MIFYYLIILIIMPVSILLAGNEKNLPVIPTPQIITELPGNFKISQTDKIIILGDTSDECMFSALQLKQTLKQFNNILVEIKNEDLPGSDDIVLDLLGKGDDSESYAILFQKDESYKLTISQEGISIKSYSTKGIFYGVMSLIQLLEKSKDSKLSALEIVDWPDMKVRGISDDISRGQVPNMDNFKRIIRFISRYKMNTYMLYIEDVLKLNSYPSIGNNRGALTNEEVKELISYAKMYHVEIIPIFQTLGHFENILTEREFLKYAEFPGAASLNVSDDDIYDFLEPMMKEVFELFPSKYFHMGADESWDVGLGRSKRKVEKSGIAKVHLEHYKKIYEIARKYGKTVLMYGDIILNNPEILKGLPKDIIIVDWEYNTDLNYPSTNVFKESGFTYYVSPTVNNYNTTFPANVNAVPNIKYLVKSGIENNASGMINSNWGDYGAETLKELCLPGYAWSAQCSWNYKSSNENKFFSDFYYDFFGIKNEGFMHLHELFNTPYSSVRWNDLWRHPLSPAGEPFGWEPKINSASRISWFDISLPIMENYVNSFQVIAKKNNDYFDILRFQANLCSWYKTKLTTIYLLQNKMSGNFVDDDFLRSQVAENISSIYKLKNTYRELWIKYNKKDNLDLIEDKFDRMTKYFEEIDKQLKTGKLVQPEISSRWIYLKTGDTTYASSARFKKDFTLKENPETAYLQLLGDTHAKFYINGKYIDEVFARGTLSLSVDYKRIKFLDVSQFLKKGENTIVVEVENFNTKGSAGFNLLSEIKFNDKSTLKIQSDNTWKVQLPDDDPDDEDEWKNVSVKEYPNYVIAPNFETKRTSWIERR